MEPLKKGPASVRANRVHPLLSELLPSHNMEAVQRLIAELEVPFDPPLIEWLVMTTVEEGTRGKIAPYADQRAYTDRLNDIFTPAGWTRRYTVTTSANFERSDDKKLVAKVFVTCELTIHGIGSHSATGEEWTDDDHAGTSAEAQAFKRACSCFGLGRYLYNFAGIWVDLDDRQRPKEIPALFGWATPEGWRKGLRPQREGSPSPETLSKRTKTAKPSRPSRGPKERELIEQIEAMAEPLGRGWYRGLLKSVARVWSPLSIRDVRLLEEVLSSLQSAERELVRLKIAQEKIGQDGVSAILKTLGIKSVERVNSLDILKKLVAALEEKAETAQL